jgi:hypothetical protein
MCGAWRSAANRRANLNLETSRGHGFTPLPLNLAYATSGGGKMLSIIVTSFGESAEAKTAVSKQQLHFGQCQR